MFLARVKRSLDARVVARLKLAWLWLEWQAFKLRTSKGASEALTSTPTKTEGERVNAAKKEALLVQTLVQEFSARKGGKFLEVGVGAWPNIERLRLLNRINVQYSGCDVVDICARHRRHVLASAPELSEIRFLPNDCGTYAWTLFALMQAGEVFDVVYLDGHHTIYVDLPAFTILHFLLAPGGCLIVDDVQWTLAFLRRNMMRFFGEWIHYHQLYDYTQYSQDQQRRPHIGMIVERLMIERLHYELIESVSSPAVSVLRKPFP